MATTIETDLKEVLSKLEQRFDRFEQKLEKIDKDITEFKVNQARMEEKLSGQINVLDEKVMGLGKRLEFQEFINRGFLIGVGVAVFTGLAKLLGWLPNP